MILNKTTEVWESCENIGELKALADSLTKENKVDHVKKIYEKIIKLDPGDLNTRFSYALLIDDGTHKNHALSRDIMLSILEECPAICTINTEANLFLLRNVAHRCNHLGPNEKAIYFFKKLTELTQSADDYASLSEVLAKENLPSEAVKALEKAIALDPGKYDNDLNHETISLFYSSINDESRHLHKSKKVVGRYPLMEDFRGNLDLLIKNHIANSFSTKDRFINKNTKFFTMGSCFARNISAKLIKNGYTSYHMEISEYINTTYANRVFIDWLYGKTIDEANNKRFHELIPEGFSAANTFSFIKNSDIFILTLGVAYAFFDKNSDEFIMPRKTQLNSRALAEKFEYRLTTVSENVKNVIYLIDAVREISPDIKIILTVSPVPLLTSFGLISCVQADCLSKSTMRLVANEVINASNIKNLHYWPSFEIFRWAGSNSSNYYGADDNASWHVSEEKVDQTISSFIDIFKT